MPFRYQGWAVLGVGLALLLSGAGYAKDLKKNTDQTTLQQTFATAYYSNPELDAARARLRAVDETVSQAHGAFRPRVRARASTTATQTETSGTGAAFVGPGGGIVTATGGASELTTIGKSVAVEAEQPIFRGLRSINRLRETEAAVRAGQSQLLRVEQIILLGTANAYANVIRDRRVFGLRDAAVTSFSRRLSGVERRFKESDLTATDLGQARAAVAKVRSDKATAVGELQVSEAAFEKQVGIPPGRLAAAWLPREHIPRSLEELFALSDTENPAIVQALYLEQAGRHAVDVIRGELYPELNLVASYSNDSARNELTNTRVNSLFVGLNLSVPLYDAGVDQSRVRQAKHNHVGLIQDIKTMRDLTREAARAAWSRWLASEARIHALRTRVEQLKTVLQGVEKEEAAGQRSIMEVLDAQDEHFEAQVLLTGAERDAVVNAYGVLQAAGRLTAARLGLVEIAYDPVVHYKDVRRQPWGTTITYEKDHPANR